MRALLFGVFGLASALGHAQLSLGLSGGAALSIGGDHVVQVPGRVRLDGQATRIRTSGLLRVGDPAVTNIVATDGAGVVCEHTDLDGGVELAMEQFASYLFPFVSTFGEAIPVRYTPRINAPGHRVRIATAGVAANNTPLPSGVANTMGPTGLDLSADMLDRHWRIVSSTLDGARIELTYRSTEAPANGDELLRATPWTGNTWGYPIAHQLNLIPQVVEMHNVPLAAGQVLTVVPVRNAAFAMDTRIAARMLLGGPYDPATGLMRDDLRSLSLVPASEPFSGMGAFALPYSGGESIAPAALSVTGSDAIVDWVLVQLRHPTTPAVVVAERAALVQRDGDVVDLDGTSTLSFPIPGDGYAISFRHRNHLGVLQAGSFSVNTNGVSPLRDISDASTPTYGSDAQRVIGAKAMLWCGDVTGNGQVKYTGNGNDRDPILQLIGGTVPTSTVSGYHRHDINLDGIVKYTGSNNDRDPVLQTIGGSVPTQTRTAQLP